MGKDCLFLDLWIALTCASDSVADRGKRPRPAFGVCWGNCLDCLFAGEG